ncbi:MAG: AAA family ATPase [bacterium]
MNLIFIYGPPAAGKLTVAKEIAKKLDYRVFMNHTLVGSIASVFPFEDTTPDKKGKDDLLRNKLARKFRVEIFKEAAKNNINVITTYGGGGVNNSTFFDDTIKSVEKARGKVYFVHLIPNEESILERVESPTRKGQKIDNKNFLKKKLIAYNYYDKYTGSDHLDIDNSNMLPEEVANQIIKYYKL